IRIGTLSGLQSEYRSFRAIFARGGKLQSMLPNNRAIPPTRPGKKQLALRIGAQRSKPPGWHGPIGRHLKANAVDTHGLETLFQDLADGSEISAPFERL